jgi:hypothetical protein
LLQVCLQLLGNGLHGLSERGGRVLTFSTKTTDAVCSVQIATEPIPGFKEGEQPAKEEYSLGLAACEGILQEHQGQISQHLREDGTLLLTVELPIAQTKPVKAKEATVPVLWQSRPYA